MKAAIATIVIIALLISGANAISLENRHQLSLNLGMWNQLEDTRTEVGPLGVETSVGSSGFSGYIMYGYWLRENLAVTFSIGGMALDISTTAGIFGVESETSAMATLLMGLKYYFVNSTLDGRVRPYLKASMGPFIGSQSSTNTGLSITTESRTETAFGGQLGTGLDFIVGRHFMMGFSLGYNLMSDFDKPIGGSRNYSGPEFNFSFCWLL